MFILKSTSLVIMLSIIMSICNIVQAANFACQTVSFNVQAINEIATTGIPIIREIKTIMENSRPVKIIHVTSTYSITTNETNKKITGFLKTNLPQDIKLVIDLEAPSNATSIRNVTLTNIPSDLVIGVTRVAESGKIINYKLSVPVTMQLDTLFTDVIVLTISN